MEDCWMAKAWERLLLAFLKKIVPAVVEINFPLEWVFHQSAVISLENPSPAMVREVASALWGTVWFSDARMLVFVAADAVPADASMVAWNSINLADFARDLFHDPPWRRTALDATGSRLARRTLQSDPATDRKVHQRWQEYGIHRK
jgi:4-hydroxy-3-polyprenylbenzoate decarboxylase